METVELGRTGRRITRIGLGAMPLSIRNRPPREQALAVVRRAVELGVDFIDTADAYSLSDEDLHHNEELIAEALREMDGRARIVVATKGGVTRPGGEWGRDGRPQHLREACEGSLRALGVERIDLYQLHAPDPQVPFEESVGALSDLFREGKIGGVGLSNVSLAQIHAAEAVVPVDSVQNRYNPWDRSSEDTGVIRYCGENRITFLPYSPVGGWRKVGLLRENADLRRIGERAGATPEELVLAWVLGTSPTLVPIPGASRVESIESSVRAAGLKLDSDTRAELESAFRSLPD